MLSLFIVTVFLMSSITWCKASCKSVSLVLCSPSWSNMSGIKDLVSLRFCSQLSAFLNTKRRGKWLMCSNSFFLSLCSTLYKYALAFMNLCISTLPVFNPQTQTVLLNFSMIILTAADLNTQRAGCELVQHVLQMTGWRVPKSAS